MRNVILYSLLFLFHLSVSGQKVSFGPTLSLNLIPINKTEIEKTSYNLGLDAGGFASYKVNDWFSVRTGLLISNTRKSYTTIDSSKLNTEILSQLIDLGLDTLTEVFLDNFNKDVIANTTGNVRLTYLKIPLTAEFTWKEYYTFSCGTYLGILIKAATREQLIHNIPLLEAYSKLDSIELPPPLSVENIITSMYPGFYEPKLSESSRKGAYATIDAGVHLGFTYLMENHFFLEAFYSRGFVNYYLNHPTGYTTLSNYHGYFKLSIGYNFGNTKLILKQE